MLAPMSGTLAQKGVEPLTTFASDGFHAASKRLTKDCPLEVSAQCLIDEPSGISCVGSLRIDNRAELAAILGIPGERITREHDLSLVIAAYRRWGADCVDRLYGDFAFALWDSAAQRALCARDHIGIVPFYFARSGGVLVFANDLAAVAAAADVSADIDRGLVANYLDTELVIPLRRTFLKSVSRLCAGHRLEFSDKGLRKARWWILERIPQVQFDSDQDYVDALDGIMARAVKDRLPAHGSVATHVTGGLDSSTVTSFLAEQCAAAGREPPIAFTWNPEPASQAERDHPEAAMLANFCERLDLPIHRQPSDEAGVLEFFSRDPLVHPTSSMLIMEIPVQRAAQELGCSTIFSGHGGDQGISYRGNGYIASLLLSGNWRGLAGHARANDVGLIRMLASAMLGVRRYVWANFKNRLPFAISRASGTFKRPTFARFSPLSRFVRGVGTTPVGARRNMLLDGYLDMRIEAWAEHGSRRGIRYVYPLLDRKLLEFALGLPPEMYARGKLNRWLMRQMLSNHAPEAVAKNRNKTEPTRSRAMVAALEGARPQLAAALDAELERSDMIDVARLRRDLTEVPIAPRGNRGPNFGRRRAALEMLDIDLGV